MCRLLGIYGQVDNWREIVTAFSKQAETGIIPPEVGAAPGHKDGWGMTVSNRKQSAMVPLIRQLGSAHDSQGYREALYALPAQPDIFLCHLRKASDTIPITLANTHPFVQNGWAFIHNGTVFGAESLPRDSALVFTSDDSDTEHLFHYLLTKINERPQNTKISGSIVDAVSSLRLDFTALNFLLSNAGELYVVRYFQKYETYYSLYYYQLADGIIICSEPIDSKGLNRARWKLLTNKCLLRIHGNPPQIEETGIWQ